MEIWMTRLLSYHTDSQVTTPRLIVLTSPVIGQRVKLGEMLLGFLNRPPRMNCFSNQFVMVDALIPRDNIHDLLLHILKHLLITGSLILSLSIRVTKESGKFFP